ncbi:MAG TPA: hypothetical protein VIJ40_05680 [Acidimicrobiales bacterium]
MPTESPHEPLSFSGGPVSGGTSQAPSKFKPSRTALILSSTGLVLIVASTFLTYARFVVNDAGISFSASRNAWQMGANGSIAFGAGPSIAFWALVSATQEFLHYRPTAFAQGFRRNFFMSGIRIQIINAVVITVLCFLSWPGSWSTAPQTSIARGVGGYVTMLGVALFAISINFHFHNVSPEPKRAA